MAELPFETPPRFDPSRIASPQTPPAPLAGGLLTVTQLTGLIKRAIQAGVPATVNVIGQISNLKRHGSGHLYFTLKDRFSELNCVMWRSDAVKMKFELRDGMEVIASGAVEVFDKAGRYQLYARKFEPRGVGALELAFRQLREKLAKEGLFDPARKRALPKFPRRIVIVTSPSGVAVRDILQAITRRYPCVHVLLYPVSVHREGAGREIAAAIRRINAEREGIGGIDVLIVGRGGGSLEDLWAFNEEVVARAIFDSAIPVISAVGHETDFTISDLVADVRAATPTAGGEIAVPVRDEVLILLTAISGRIVRRVRIALDLSRERLVGMLRIATQRQPLLIVRQREQLLDEQGTRVHAVLAGRLQIIRRRLARVEACLQRIAPHRYLLRTSARLNQAERSLRVAVMRAGKRSAVRFDEAALALRDASPRRQLERFSEQIARCETSLRTQMTNQFKLAESSVNATEKLLSAVGYKSVLGRGFSITRTKRGRQVVRSASQLHDGERLMTQLVDGEVESETIATTQGRLFTKDE